MILSQIAFARRSRTILAGIVGSHWDGGYMWWVMAYVVVVMSQMSQFGSGFGRLSVDGDFENPYLFGTPCP